MNTLTPPAGPPGPAWAPPAPRTEPPPERRSGALVSKIVGTLAVLGVALGLVTMSSLALFTDSEVVDANSFSTGTIDLATSPTTAAFSPGNLAPGDQVVAEIDVINSGSLGLRYALTSTTTEDFLASQLDLTVRVGVTDCSVANWDASGTEVAATDILGSTTTDTVFGNVAPGGQAGDRALGVAGAETLCMHVELPLTSDNTYQGVSTTATFNFAAEQTANN